MLFLTRFIRLTVQNRPSISRLASGVETSRYDAKNLSIASNDKPPPKPKKPLNMFLRFSKEIRPKVIEENPNAKLTEVGRIVGEMWRKADDDVKQRLKKAFEEDMKCYNTQLIPYKEYLAHNPELKSEKVKSTRNQQIRSIKNRLKQMGYPKRPLNSLAAFLLSKKNSKPANVMSMDFLNSLQKEWMSLSDDEKQIYKNKYEESKKQYLEELKKWNESLDQDPDGAKLKLVKKLRALEAQTSKPKILSAAYMLYVNKYKAEKPEGISMISWVRELNSRWNSMSKAERKEYSPSPSDLQTEERSKTESHEKVQPSHAKKPSKKEYDLLSSESQSEKRSKNKSQKKTQPGHAKKQKNKTSETVVEATVADSVIEVQTTICKKLSLDETQSSTVEEETSKTCPMSDTKVIVDTQSVQVPKTNSIKNIYENLIGFFKK